MATDYGAVLGDVQARLAKVTFSPTSVPASTTVTGWLEEAEAKINNALRASGITAPVTYAEGVEQLKSLSIDYAEGRARCALGPPGSDNETQGVKQLDTFAAVIKDILDNGSLWDALLNGGSSQETSTHLRNFVTHDVLGRASTHTDFEPTFTKADGGDQF